MDPLVSHCLADENADLEQHLQDGAQDKRGDQVGARRYHRREAEDDEKGVQPLAAQPTRVGYSRAGQRYEDKRQLEGDAEHEYDERDEADVLTGEDKGVDIFRLELVEE